MAEISTYHIQSHPELYQPAVSNTFQFIINENLNRLLFAGIDQQGTIQEEDYLNNIQETIKLSVVESSVPHFKISPIEVRRGNSKALFAGLPEFDAGSLKLDDFVGARTKDALLAWQAQAYDVINDVVNSAEKYKYDCTLVEYNPDQSAIVRQWTLIGCWISDISEDPFNHENRDKRSINATIQYDRAIPKAIV